MIHKGQAVRIKPEWQDPGDALVMWRAAEDEDGGRVLIVAELGWRINPTQQVETRMLEVNER